MDISLSQNFGGSAAVMAAYVVAFILSRSLLSFSLLAVCFAAQSIAFTDIYVFILEHYPEKTFLIYSAIYSSATFLIYAQCRGCYTSKKYKLIALCFTMALFEHVAYRAYINELGFKVVEEWAYSNYEIIVALLHGLIVFQMVHWGSIRLDIGNFRDMLQRAFVVSRVFLPSGSKAGYNEATKNNPRLDR